MRIVARPAQDFPYSSEAHEFFVDAEIVTDVPVEIACPVDVTYAALTKAGDEDLSFGYSQRVFPAKRPSNILMPGQPLQLRINVFEHDDDFTDFTPGEYRCDIDVLVVVRGGVKSEMLKLSDSFIVHVA